MTLVQVYTESMSASSGDETRTLDGDDDESTTEEDPTTMLDDGGRSPTSEDPVMMLNRESHMGDSSEEAVFSERGRSSSRCSCTCRHEMERLWDELGRLKHRIKCSEQADFENSTNIGSLKVAMVKLKETTHGYRQMRARFFDRFQRYCLKSTDVPDHSEPEAWQGDALGDSHILQQADAESTDAFAKLYGLRIEQVIQMDEWDYGEVILGVLNARASTWVTEGRVPDPMEAAFQHFLAMYHRYPHVEPVTEPDSRIGLAYYTFYRTMAQHARKLPFTPDVQGL